MTLQRADTSMVANEVQFRRKPSSMCVILLHPEMSILFNDLQSQTKAAPTFVTLVIWDKSSFVTPLPARNLFPITVTPVNPDTSRLVNDGHRERNSSSMCVTLHNPDKSTVSTDQHPWRKPCLIRVTPDTAERSSLVNDAPHKK